MRGRAVGCEFAMRDVGRKPAAVAAEAINSAAAIARISGFCWSSKLDSGERQEGRSCLLRARVILYKV